jgi:malate dehydrogenase
VIAIISNPVNSTVPIAAEIMKQKQVYDPRKIVGVTTLDVVRAQTFVAPHLGNNVNPSTVTPMNVIGGHAGITILPLFSQVPGFAEKVDDNVRHQLTVRTQFGGDEVVAAKAGSGSATLSMAYAGYLFTENVLKAMSGDTSIVQCAYVESSVVPNVPYFASPCVFGPNGVEQVMGYGTISSYEQEWLDKLVPELQQQIQKGVDFVHKK